MQCSAGCKGKTGISVFPGLQEQEAISDRKSNKKYTF
jgi:hypothetical protein